MSRFGTVAVLSTLTALAAPLRPARADAYVTTNLITSNSALFPAQITDPTFINPWGMSQTATSPLWVSVTGPGTATLYRGDVNGSAFTQVSPPSPVTIPGGRVTGQVVNTGGFQLANGTNANFIFAARTGQISAWNGGAGTTAQTQTTPTANITGQANTPAGTSPGTLYAANNTVGGTIDVFRQTSPGTLTPIIPSGTFTVPGLPAGLAPFNVQQIGGLLYVTYDNPATYGNPNNLNGSVDVFDLNGNFLRSAADPSHLAAPWGVAIAPSNFGPFSNDLLVGNFNNNQINAFDPNTGAFLGTLAVTPGGTGDWGLQFGNGVAGNANTLFVADGFNDQAGGLLLAIDPVVPEPGSLGLFLVGGAGLWLFRRRKARPA